MIISSVQPAFTGKFNIPEKIRRFKAEQIQEHNEFVESKRETELHKRNSSKTEKVSVICQKNKHNLSIGIYSRFNEELGRLTADKPEHIYDDCNTPSMQIFTLKTINLGNASSEYKGIGTELLKQAVIESQKQGCGGRIILYASNKETYPTPFYYKMGLRFQDDKLNSQMENYLAGKGNLDGISSGVMYLPEENIAALLAKK